MIKYVFEAMRMNEINIEQMEYLFLRRKRSSAVSERQKNLLFKAAQAALGGGVCRQGSEYS